MSTPDPTRVPRVEGLVNLVQAAIFFGFAVWLKDNWAAMAWIVGAAGVTQVLGGLALSATANPRPARWADLLALGLCAFVVGLHLQVGVHIINTFSPEGAKTGWEIVGKAMLALPYGAFLPFWQLIRLRGTRVEGGAAAAAVLAGLVLPPMAALGGGADRTWSEIDGAEATAWVYDQWSGEEPDAPTFSEGPVALVATAFEGSSVPHRSFAEGATLSEALLKLEPPGQEFDAVVLELLTREGALKPLPFGPERGVLLGAGDRGVRGAQRVVGAAELLRNPSVRNRAVLPEVYAPTAALKGVTPGNNDARWFNSRGWVTSGADVAPLRRGWADGAPLGSEAIVEAALAGGRHLLHNMNPKTGRFTYIVEGPSGKRKGGYNYPRHAGTSWFLARLFSRTGDADIRVGLDDALRHLKDVTQSLPDGRAYILDPSRKDGQSWVGTTALALLAFLEADADPTLQRAYVAHIASSITDEGVVRGNFDIKAKRWPQQHEITYAQGQGLLALAAAERAGVEGGSEALDRAIAYVEGDYMPMPGSRAGTLDEHWMCLAAEAVGRVRDTFAGEAICRAYVDKLAPPTSGAMKEPYAGAAAGLGEAVIALAEIERLRGETSSVRDDAMQYGHWLLEQQYRPADAAFLDDADNLIGGWRDRPYGPYDVQIDEVQHIACALLGVEQLMAGEEIPGAMP